MAVPNMLENVLNIEIASGAYRGVGHPYLTLPYLTLPYFSLPYLILQYLTLPGRRKKAPLGFKWREGGWYDVGPSCEDLEVLAEVGETGLSLGGGRRGSYGLQRTRARAQQLKAGQYDEVSKTDEGNKKFL